MTLTAIGSSSEQFARGWRGAMMLLMLLSARHAVASLASVVQWCVAKCGSAALAIGVVVVCGDEKETTMDIAETIPAPKQAPLDPN